MPGWPKPTGSSRGRPQRLKDAQEARRTVEKDAAVYQGRLTKFKDQLSAVKTNREYTAMQHEIETAQKDLGAAEEKVLERMMEIDELTDEVKQAETARAAQKKAVDAEKAALATELAAVEKTLAETTAARAGVVASVEPRLMSLFEQVAKVRKGVALSMATRDGLCSICHVRMRPQVFQQVRTNDSVVQCDSCQRILYWVPPPAPDAAPRHDRVVTQGSFVDAPSPGGAATAHVDGGSRGNPGPAGYGVFITRDDGSTVEIKQSIGIATNNVAEYNGLLAALRWAADNGIRSLTVRADSELMVKQMRGDVPREEPWPAAALRGGPSLARRLARVTFEHVRREFNQDADRLANEAMDEAAASPDSGGTSTKPLRP